MGIGVQGGITHHCKARTHYKNFHILRIKTSVLSERCSLSFVSLQWDIISLGKLQQQ